MNLQTEDKRMPVKLEKELQAAAAYLRQLFYEDPQLSVDSAARLVKEKFPRGLNKGMISQIRMEVRLHIDQGYGYTDHIPPLPDMPKQRESFTNHPRLKESEPQPMTPEPIPEVEMEQKVEQKPPETKPAAEFSVQERKKWFEDWALNNPQYTVPDAKRILIDKFGVSFATAYISQTMRVAKQLTKENSEPGVKKTATEPNKPAIQKPEIIREQPEFMAARASSTTISATYDELMLVKLLRKLSISKVELMDSGAYSFVYTKVIPAE